MPFMYVFSTMTKHFPPEVDGTAKIHQINDLKMFTKIELNSFSRLSDFLRFSFCSENAMKWNFSYFIRGKLSREKSFKKIEQIFTEMSVYRFLSN